MGEVVGVMLSFCYLRILVPVSSVSADCHWCLMY